MRFITNLKYGAMTVATCIMIMGAAKDCEAPPPQDNDRTMNTEDGKHTISELGKWKYGTTMATSVRYPQCRWEIWGLQKDGWKQLYKGKVGKVELPPKGVYAGAYLKSTSCGKWHEVK